MSKKSTEKCKALGKHYGLIKLYLGIWKFLNITWAETKRVRLVQETVFHGQISNNTIPARQKKVTVSQVYGMGGSGLQFDYTPHVIEAGCVLLKVPVTFYQLPVRRFENREC